MTDIAEQYVINREGVRIIEAFRLEHSSFASIRTDPLLPTSILLASVSPDPEFGFSTVDTISLPLAAGGPEFKFLPSEFNVVQPSKNESGRQEIEVRLPITSDALATMTDGLNTSADAVLEPVEATYYAYLSDQTAQGPRPPTPLPLRVTEISKADAVILLRLGRALNPDRQIPRAVYTADNSPGLVR